MTEQIELRKLAATILKSLNNLDFRSEKRGKKSITNCSRSQMQKAAAESSWDGMEREKLEHRLHVVMVDLGICKMCDPEKYQDSEFILSPFHKYKWVKEKPKRLTNHF